jgi:hypothetical protein
MRSLYASSIAVLLAIQSVGSSVLAKTPISASNEKELKDRCSELVVNSRLSRDQILKMDDGGVPSVEEVSKAIQVTQCNWELIKGSAKNKAWDLTGRINLIKVLSTSATVLGAGGTAASAAGNNTGLAIGSGAVAIIGIFTGVFGSEATIKRRDMCNQLVTLDPTNQTTFNIWMINLSSESFRKGFASELLSYNSAIDAGVKGCIADSFTS